MNECTDYANDPLKGDRKVVCAAIRSRKNGKIICGARHYDPIMRSQLEVYDAVAPIDKASIEQGFIDNFGNFLTREEAWLVAKAAGQVIKVCGGNGSGKLFSENLY